MVDYALRRRFRFIELEPGFHTNAFKEYLTREMGVQPELAKKIVERMTALNEKIAADDKNLGRGYRIGHSFFCPGGNVIPDEAWYIRVVRNEIVPLLEEYWFDNPDEVELQKQKLIHNER